MATGDNDFIVWEGVYGSFEEASGSAAAFDSELWVNKLRTHTEGLLAALRTDVPLPEPAVSHDYILPVVAALSQGSCEKVTIVDFGGGLGASYLSILATIPGSSEMDFHIVEGKAVVEAGREVFASYPRVHFHTDPPLLKAPITIVHAGSSIHYVEDWRAVISTLADYDPRYMVFTDLPAGEIKTFVTMQNFYGAKIPVWFWNIDEFVSTIESFGFRWIYRSRYISPSPLVRRAIRMDNFPKKYRLGSCCQLLFERWQVEE